jgi:hypothetical protein
VTALTIAVVGALGLWFLATAVVQLPYAWCQGVRRYDPIGHLLPGWSFFAPRPIGGDCSVWYRSWESYDPDRDKVLAGDKVLEDSSLPWIELAGIETRRITDALVYPGRYTRKSIFTCCSHIAGMLIDPNHRPDSATGLPPDTVMLSLPYLLLTEKVSSVCKHAVAAQFRIDVVRRGEGTSQPVTVFRSAVHRIEVAAPCPDAIHPGRVAAP